MSEIENKQDHSLLPNDFFVIVSDPENLYRRLEKEIAPNQKMTGWNIYLSLTEEEFDKGSIVNNADLRVNRVDGDMVDCVYRYYLGGTHNYNHLTIDMSKVDYKRIVCNW